MIALFRRPPPPRACQSEAEHNRAAVVEAAISTGRAVLNGQGDGTYGEAEDAIRLLLSVLEQPAPAVAVSNDVDALIRGDTHPVARAILDIMAYCDRYATGRHVRPADYAAHMAGIRRLAMEALREWQMSGRFR